MSTKTEAEFSNPFDDPFAGIEFGEADKASKGGVPEWSGPVPATIQAAVDRAIASGKRQYANCDNVALRTQLHSASKAALALRTKELAIHTRDETDEHGNLVKFTFTVGAPRGRKPESAEATESE